MKNESLSALFANKLDARLGADPRGEIGPVYYLWDGRVNADTYRPPISKYLMI